MKSRLIVTAAAVLLFALVGCSSTPPPTEEPVVVEPATEEPAEENPSPEVNERGNFVKALGETSGITDSADQVLAEFTVNSITLDPGCTGEFATAPENGHFLVVDISIQTTPEYSDGDLWVDAGAWKTIAVNGTTVNQTALTAASLACLSEAESLPSLFGAAENLTGKVALDVPNTEGILVLEDVIMGGGWEWTYPAG